MIFTLAGFRNSGSSSVSREIAISDLARISFPTYLVLIRIALVRAGYEFVGSLGRRHLRGRKQCGGADFIIAFQSRQGTIKVLLQVKQETRHLQRRYVGELRDAMIRKGISHGMIVTLGQASKAATFAADEFPGRPVSIIEGRKLVEFLRETVKFNPHDLANLSAMTLGLYKENDEKQNQKHAEIDAPILPANKTPAPVNRNRFGDIELVISFLVGLIIGVLAG
jgi:hypothetical protein